MYMMALLGIDQLQEELDILSSKHYYRYGFCHRHSHCQFEQNHLGWISSLACNTTNWQWKWFSLMVQSIGGDCTDGSLYQLSVKMANGGPNVVLLRVADRQGPLACVSTLDRRLWGWVGVDPCTHCPLCVLYSSISISIPLSSSRLPLSSSLYPKGQHEQLGMVTLTRAPSPSPVSSSLPCLFISCSFFLLDLFESASLRSGDGGGGLWYKEVTG
jgi:hypothetical protein